MWCYKAKYNAGNKNYFGRWFIQACPGIENFRPIIDGRRQYAYRGITLSDWVYSQYLGRPKG